MANIRMLLLFLVKIILSLPFRNRKISWYPLSFFISRLCQLKEIIFSIKDSRAFCSSRLNLERSFLRVGIHLAQSLENFFSRNALFVDSCKISYRFPLIF